MSRIEKKKKLILIISTSILTLFFVYNAAYFYVRNSYHSYITNFDTTIKHFSYHKINTTKHYIANVKYPSYGSFTGNLAINTENNDYGLIIWPKYNSELEISLQGSIDSPVEDNEQHIQLNNGSIDLTHSSLPKDTQTIVLKLEEEAKLLWGDDILKNADRI
ncbi:hypothetical protein OL233_00560 [Vagococcus sp. PNs007]|uniref:Uncharacterized protein n=1 Tax=Vagococcus proximus TaxID=2991417 RepID=A0ABT5WYC5_9ENTE|nr:hypothetical protein [Vagococcus proximus]MDF0478763.1 hypothetical protein [Vagococcus proximus]